MSSSELKERKNGTLLTRRSNTTALEDAFLSSRRKSYSSPELFSQIKQKREPCIKKEEEEEKTAVRSYHDLRDPCRARDEAFGQAATAVSC